MSKITNRTGCTPRREFLKGISPVGPDRNALQRAVTKSDAVLDCENRRYIIKKGEEVYFRQNNVYYTIYSTLVRRRIAKLTEKKFQSLFKIK